MGRILKSLVFSLFFILISTLNVRASETMSLPITGRYDQSGARALLELVNSKRSEIEGRQALVYDQELENAAMLRAMEISVYFNKTRPDGSTWSTVLENPGSACQLTAYGQLNSEQVFAAWMSGSGNKTALMSSSYSYMGASHVTREGVEFWVVILRKDVGKASEKKPVNDKRTVNVSMLSTKVLSNVTRSTIDIEYGDEFDISDLKEECAYSGALGINKKWAYSISSSVTLSDDDIIALKDKKLIAKKAGYTGITATLRTTGAGIVIPVSVAKKVITEDNINLSAREFPYTGKAIKPEVTVSISGKDLKEGDDYVMVYGDNVNVSSKGGYVSVTGLGNYDGTAKKYFMIEALDIGSGNIIIKEPVSTYTGSPITPAYVVTFNEKTLVESTDYIVKFSNNTDPGMGHLTIYGMGNYMGTLDAEFLIEEKAEEVFSVPLPSIKLSFVKGAKKKMTIRWKKASQIDGYEVQYSTSKSFGDKKTVTKTCRPDAKKTVIKKLKSGKKYYVRIRSYKISEGLKFYSDWSKTKKVKIK